jgi:hypothetical protein
MTPNTTHAIASGVFFGLVLSTSAVSPASASLTFNFSFSNTIGNVPGTVTGRIIGLVDNATSSATGAFIDSAPTDLNWSPLPVDVFDHFNEIVSNSFTVAGGVIIDASFRATTNFNPAWLWINDDSNNFLDISNNANNFYVWNRDGFNGVSFTSAQVPGPTPIFGTALAFGLSRKLKRRIANGSQSKTTLSPPAPSPATRH